MTPQAGSKLTHYAIEIGLNTMQILQLPGPSTTELGSRIILLGCYVFTLVTNN